MGDLTRERMHTHGRGARRDIRDMGGRGLKRCAAWAVVMLAALAWPTAAGAQMVPEPPPLKHERAADGFTDPGELPEEVRGAGLEQKLEAEAPLDAAFVNAAGEAVTLGDYFTDDRPVLLSFGYYECPGLCPMVWQGMSQAFGEMGWTPGDEFEVVTISVSASETPEQAREAKAHWTGRLDDPETAATGWHFLVGEADAIARVANAVGFGYNALPDDPGQYAHQAAIVIMSPDGRVMRYMGGTTYPPQTLRLSLVEASEGKVGSMMDQVVLFCSAFDAESNSYKLAMGAMRAGGALTVAGLILGVALMVRIGRRRRATPGPAG